MMLQISGESGLFRTSATRKNKSFALSQREKCSFRSNLSRSTRLNNFRKIDAGSCLPAEIGKMKDPNRGILSAKRRTKKITLLANSDVEEKKLKKCFLYLGKDTTVLNLGALRW